MIQSLQRIAKNNIFILILIICSAIFFKTPLSGNWEQKKIIQDLQSLFENSKLFYGCTFTMFNGDLPEHKEYYENIRTRGAVTSDLWDRLHYELVPRNLYYFYQFKERINVTRQHGSYKKSVGNYCLLYTKEFYEKTKPRDKYHQKNFQENQTKCDKNYDAFCMNVNNIEGYINEGFLRYYALGYSSYDKCKAIYDHGLVQLANGNLEEAVKLADDFLDQVSKENRNLNSFSSEQLLNLGVTFNEAMEYSKAIEYLNLSIIQDPFNKEAYFHRAIAYLETSNFDNAVNDFRVSEKGKGLPQIESKATTEFIEAFMNGLVEGSHESLINFFPSLYSFAFANVFHPIDSLTHYANACYELMLITDQYLKEVDWSKINPIESQLATILLEPGLKRLYEKIDGLSPTEQGKLLGHAIGSSGMDFVAGVGVIKGIKSCAKLGNACKTAREASRVYELSTLAETESSVSTSIIAEATERATIRETIVQKAKNARIVTKNSNVQFHVMQQKHAWNKVLELSGNTQEDFQKVLAFLEERDILNPKYLRNTIELPENATVKNIYVLTHRTTFEGYKIEVIFEKYLDTGEVFLKNGWIVTEVGIK